MSAEALSYVDKLLKTESQGWGDLSNAVDRIANKAGVSRWTVEHIRKGRAKSVSTRVKEALRQAYLTTLEKQLVAILNEIEAVKARGGAGDDLRSIEAEAEALVARFQAARSASLSRTGGR